MQGGIFHACWSFTVTLRGGEWSTGTGGDGGPRGCFLCLFFAGSMGSTCASTIRIMRCFAPCWNPGALGFGVYLMNLASDCAAFIDTVVMGFDAATLAPMIFSIAARVFSCDSICSSSVGNRSFASSPSLAFISARDVYICLSLFDPCFTMASYFTSPFASTSTDTIAVLESFFLLGRPISNGYWETWISGNAPPSPKSPICRGI
mmetsp:Transcript_64104/g.88077  ORF Transcript_64104/g.88077 Transcript_64104/m.88077 type:complete len:205 (+) Transcript_64104:1358-1972(+)